MFAMPNYLDDVMSALVLKNYVRPEHAPFDM